MTAPAPLISASNLISWLNRMALNNPRIPVEHVKAHIRYMQAAGARDICGDEHNNTLRMRSRITVRGENPR